ncbi:MAG: tRNA (adenosine(37)-N6)-dimethylallyltransferase MiaA [Betaproteobacteria bacterium]|nr:tRNA (adenosine(37)-N6)-dimethylallyltransferase MiaA [Betaproteobacteria bacterium]
MPADLPPAIFLLGPTASGKTALALELVDRFPVEIISVDSALVYRDMNVGTAKPEAATLKKYPHHLVDLIDPTEAYSAARFCRDATQAMNAILSRGKVPLLVGGTMLYAKALLEGLSELPEADAEVRAELEAQAARIGWPEMHAELAKIDAETARRLKPNDSQRIQRALEVFQLTGVPMSTLQTRAPIASAFPWRTLQIGLMPGDRGVLHQRIATRFDTMLEGGLVDEVVSLRERYRLTPDLPSMRCVGYRQAWQFIDGDIDRTALRETGIAATRQLAKRQMTWLRSMNKVETLDCLAKDLSATAMDRCNRFLKQSVADS